MKEGSPISTVGFADEPSIQTRPGARPWGLRGLRPAQTVGTPDYRYDPERQIAVTPAGDPWLWEIEGSNHSSIAELDGDEGRSESWGEDAGKDVTEGV